MKEMQTEKGIIKLPCLDAILVPTDKVIANDYNPNYVSDRNMALLLLSIKDNGFCFPVVTSYDKPTDLYVVIDGFHRHYIFKEVLKAKEIPVVVLDIEPSQRMKATIQFNRARGVHQVEGMSELVRRLIGYGINDEEIAKGLGMDLEEVYRLKQITGIAELFKNQSYSRSWEMQEVDEDE